MFLLIRNDPKEDDVILDKIKPTPKAEAGRKGFVMQNFKMKTNKKKEL